MYPVLEIGAHSGNSMAVGMAKFQIQIRKVFGQVHYWLRNFWIFLIKKQYMLSEHPDKNENENEILWSEIRMITDATIGKDVCLPWLECLSFIPSDQLYFIITHVPYLIIVTDATDAVSVNFSGRCKFLLIQSEKLAFSTDFTRKVAFYTDLTRKIGVFRCKFYSPKILPV